MTDPLDQVYDYLDAAQFDQAITLAKREAERDKEYEFLYRRLIGKAILDSYFLKKRTIPELKLDEEAYIQFKTSWNLTKEDNEFTLVLLADAELELRKLNDAEAHYSELIEILKRRRLTDIDLSNCYERLASIEFLRENFEKALVLSQNVLDRKDTKEFKEWGKFYRLRSSCLKKLGNLDEAETEVKQALRYLKDPFSYGLYLEILREQNKYSEYESVMKSLPSLFHQSPPIQHSKAQLLVQQKKYQEAVEILKKLKHPDAELSLATAYMKWGKYSEAIDIFEAHFVNSPDDLGVLNNLGVCYLATQQLDYASKCFRKIIQKKQNDIHAMTNLAQIEFKLALNSHDMEKEKHLEESLKLYEKGINTQQTFAKATNYNGLGLVYMERQQYEEAEEMFNECISSEPRFVLGWANKARVAQVLGKQNEAKESIIIALDMLENDFVKQMMTDKNIEFINATLAKILNMQEIFEKAALQINQDIQRLQDISKLKKHETLEQAFDDSEKRVKEIMLKLFQKIAINQMDDEINQDFDALMQHLESLKLQIQDEIEKQQREEEVQQTEPQSQRLEQFEQVEKECQKPQKQEVQQSRNSSCCIIQ